MRLTPSYLLRRLPKGFPGVGVPSGPPGEDRTNLADKKFILKLHRAGCTNRQFYHIVVTKVIHLDSLETHREPPLKPPSLLFQSTYPKQKYVSYLEQVGTFDPLPNAHGEKLCSLNLERIVYYLSQGIEVDEPIGQLLGTKVMITASI